MKELNILRHSSAVLIEVVGAFHNDRERSKIPRIMLVIFSEIANQKQRNEKAH